MYIYIHVHHTYTCEGTEREAYGTHMHAWERQGMCVSVHIHIHAWMHTYLQTKIHTCKHFTVGFLVERKSIAMGQCQKSYSKQGLPYRVPSHFPITMTLFTQLWWEWNGSPLQEHETFSKITSCRFLKNNHARGVLWESFVFLEGDLTVESLQAHRNLWRGSLRWGNAMGFCKENTA